MSTVKKLLAEKTQLDKEAEWLANILARGCSNDLDDDCSTCPATLGSISCPCPSEDCRHILAKGWREAARKAVEENQ